MCVLCVRVWFLVGGSKHNTTNRRHAFVPPPGSARIPSFTCSYPHPPTHPPTHLVGEVLERADGDGLLGRVARRSVVLRLVRHHHLQSEKSWVCVRGYL